MLFLALLCSATSPGGADEGRGAFCQRVAEHFSSGWLAPEEVPDGAVIGRIEISVLDIFETSREGPERRLPYRAANRLHVSTRPEVIERQLLFASGDRFDARALEESERRLREEVSVYDACIAPVRVRGSLVDVQVVTRDVWTLGLGAGFGRSGQANTVQFGIEDGNFLGTGRLMELKYTDDPDRSEHRFRYQDPALFGTRGQLALMLAERSDGYRYTLDAVRPFFSLDTRWSAGGRWVSDREEVKLYSRGQVTDRFAMDETSLELSGGLSHGFTGSGSHRLLAGFTWDRRDFGEIPDPSGSPPAAVPVGRTLAYPWIGYQWIEDGFVERHNMNRLARTEDWNLGTTLTLRAGWSSPTWGADRSEAISSLDWSRGVATRDGRHVLLLDAHAGGRFGSGTAANVLAGGRLRHFFADLGRHQLWSSLQFDAARNLDPENQLLLGGDSGLRGYPLRFRDGDRRVLATVEQRFYTNLEVLKLFHVGAAIFFDAGRAWYADAPPGADDGILRDVGVGLRLGSSRSAKGAMVHLDVAFPLDGARSERRGLQWLVRTQQSF